jgi:hypothetical protein
MNTSSVSAPWLVFSRRRDTFAANNRKLAVLAHSVLHLAMREDVKVKLVVRKFHIVRPYLLQDVALEDIFQLFERP